MEDYLRKYHQVAGTVPAPTSHTTRIQTTRSKPADPNRQSNQAVKAVGFSNVSYIPDNEPVIENGYTTTGGGDLPAVDYEFPAPPPPALASELHPSSSIGITSSSHLTYGANI